MSSIQRKIHIRKNIYWLYKIQYNLDLKYYIPLNICKLYTNIQIYMIIKSNKFKLCFAIPQFIHHIILLIKYYILQSYVYK